MIIIARYLSSSVLTQLRYHMPALFVVLLEGAIDLWNQRCKLIHPKEPLPLHALPKRTFSLQRKLRRAKKTPGQTPRRGQRPPDPNICTEATIGWPHSLSDLTHTCTITPTDSTAGEEPSTGFSLQPYVFLSPLSPVRTSGFDEMADADAPDHLATPQLE